MKIIKKDYWHTFKKKPTKKYLQDYYSNKYFKEDLNFNYKLKSWEIKYNYLMSLMRIKMIKMNSKEKLNTKTLLDVGFGKGDFLRIASKKFNKTCGVDFSTKQISESLGKNCTVISENPLEFLKRKRIEFDFISLNNILEHSLDPKEILEYLRNNTKKNARFLITIPNDFSKLQKVTSKIIKKKYWLTWPEHLNYINKKDFLKSINKKFTLVDAFSDYPVELFLLAKNMNYIKDKKLGKTLHETRCKSINAIYDLTNENILIRMLKNFYDANIGRNNTFLLRKN